MVQNTGFHTGLFSSRVLRLDGAMGTQIQSYGLTEADFRQGIALVPTRDVKGDNECLNLSRPDVIRAIHQAYVDAGADILETNSFGANALVQQDYGLEELAPEMAFAAARLAREVADGAPRKVWVAGSLGPTSKSLSLVSDFLRPEWRPCSFDEMAAAYEAQVRALIEGGVDLIQIETCFDALNAKAAIYAVERVRSRFPVIVSVSVSNGFGRTLTGQGLEAFFTAVSHANLVAFGLNCSMGAEGLVPLVRELSTWCPVPLICYPNAGLPNAQGAYDETPATMAAHMAALDGLVNIAGGCCGTTPDHIRALPAIRPRPVPSPCTELKVSGLEAYALEVAEGSLAGANEATGDCLPSGVSNVMNAGLNPSFAAFLDDEEYDEALMLAGEAVAEGAVLLDVNLDGRADSAAEMDRFVRLTQSDPSVSCAALMIDSADWDTLLAGLKNAQGKCVAKCLSLREGESALLEKAAVLRSLGAAIVIKEEDPAARQRALDLLVGSGIPQQEILF